MEKPTNTCEECGLSFFYDPKYHECAHKSDPRMMAAVERVRGESWVDECMRKQREGIVR